MLIAISAVDCSAAVITTRGRPSGREIPPARRLVPKAGGVTDPIFPLDRFHCPVHPVCPVRRRHDPRDWRVTGVGGPWWCFQWRTPPVALQSRWSLSWVVHGGSAHTMSFWTGEGIRPREPPRAVRYVRLVWAYRPPGQATRSDQQLAPARHQKHHTSPARRDQRQRATPVERSTDARRVLNAPHPGAARSPRHELTTTVWAAQSPIARHWSAPLERSAGAARVIERGAQLGTSARQAARRGPRPPGPGLPAAFRRAWRPTILICRAVLGSTAGHYRADGSTWTFTAPRGAVNVHVGRDGSDGAR